MIRYDLLVLLILMTVATAWAGEPPLPPGVTVTSDAQPETPGVASWTVTSPYQQGANKVEYLLPDPVSPGKRYPVVYCLPVNPGTAGKWGHPLTVARELGLANRHQVILVTPAYDAWPWFGGNPQRPEFRQSDYLTEVVIPLVEARLPALAEPRGRFLLGFSKSGHGALGILLRHRADFAQVALFETWFGQPNAKQWTEWGLDNCYGTRESYDAWNPQNLLDAQRAELVAEPSRITVLNGGPGARLGVEQLLAQLRDRKIPHTLIANPAWGHTWTSGWLPLALTAMLP